MTVRNMMKVNRIFTMLRAETETSRKNKQIETSTWNACKQ